MLALVLSPPLCCLGWGWGLQELMPQGRGLGAAVKGYVHCKALYLPL